MDSQLHITQTSLSLAHDHYENFPVASVFLPKSLREPVALIYRFARQADDYADEGELSIEERLKLLSNDEDELKLIEAYIQPSQEFFKILAKMIWSRQLSLQPFLDLIDAFKQDVVKTRYENFDEVLDYCRRSANPIGRLLLQLYQAGTTKNIGFSDNICTALQLINFLQDIAIDFEKNAGKQRIYMCQNELLTFGLTEENIQTFVRKQSQINDAWVQFMRFNLSRASTLLQAGKPLGKALTGRIGFEMRMIIAGGEQIIAKIARVQGDVFNHRPTLNVFDWCVIFLKSLFYR